MKRKFIWSVLLFLMVVMAGCVQPQPLKIGFIGTLMGGTSTASVSGRNGVILAVEQFNHNGGLRGRKLQLITKDDQSDLKTAREVSRELIGENVNAIIGYMTSNMTLGIVNEINRSQTIFISPASGGSRLVRKDDYVIRMQPPLREAAELLAEKMIPRFGLKQMAIVYDKIYSPEWHESFQKRYLLTGGRIVTIKTFSSELSTSFYNMAVELLALRVDGILIIANPNDTAMLCQQIRKIGSNAPLFTTNWAVADNIIELGGPAIEGLIFPEIVPDNTNPAYQKFRREYAARFGTNPPLAAIKGYEATLVLIDALTRCQRLTSDVLKKQIIAKPVYQSIGGELSFDRYGDAERGYKLFTISDGKIRRLK